MEGQITPERFEHYEKTRELRRHKLDNEGRYFYTLEGKLNSECIEVLKQEGIYNQDHLYSIIKWFPAGHEKEDLVKDYHGQLQYFHEESDVGQLTELISVYAHWVAFDIIKGQSLTKALRTSGPFQAAEALRLCDQIAAALEKASDFGVVHLSLNPANVFIVNGSVVIKDWVLNQDFLDLFSQIGETHDYYAPDLMDMHTADERSDMYSLGLVCAYMLTGEWAVKELLEDPGRLPESLMQRIEPLLSPRPSSRPDTWKGARTLFTAKKIISVPMLEKKKKPSREKPLLKINKGAALAAGAEVAAAKEREKKHFVMVGAEGPKKEKKPPKEKPARVQERIEARPDRGSWAAFRAKLTPKKIALGVVIAIIVVMVAFIPLGASGLFKESSENKSLADSRQSPSFVGLTKEEAEALAAQNSVALESEERFSNEIEAGKIISQEPGPGSEISDQPSIKVLISKGPENVEEAPPADVAVNDSSQDTGGGASGNSSGGGGGDSTLPPPPPSGSPPVAAFTYSPPSGPSSGTFVSCNASGSYDPDGGSLTYSWSFGGGGVTASCELVSSTVADKAITLTVVDSEGKKASVTHYVHLY